MCLCQQGSDRLPECGNFAIGFGHWLRFYDVEVISSMMFWLLSLEDFCGRGILFDRKMAQTD